MSPARRNPGNTFKTAIAVICVLLILGAFAYKLLDSSFGKVLSKEEISESLEKYEGESLSYRHLSSYLKRYGIGNIDGYKLKTVEKELNDSYYKELPSMNTLSHSIAERYLSEYYDVTDNEDKVAVTDAILHCLFAELGDRYAYYRTAKEYESYMTGLDGTSSFAGIGIMIDKVTMTVLTVYKDSPAEAAGMLAGDVIIAVDGKTVSEYGSDSITEMIRGEVGTEVTVTVHRKGENLDLTATRAEVIDKTVTYRLLEDGEVGYIIITKFLRTTPEQFREAIDYCISEGVDSMVIDVRGNPGGLLTAVIDVIDYIIPDAEGRVLASYTHSGEKSTFYTDDGHGTALPFTVICNENTASAGELFTGAVRDLAASGVINAKIIGKTTYGKGLVQDSFRLYDKSGITFTVGYFNPPCDINFNGVGVSPDITVETVMGADAQLERAVEEAMALAEGNRDVSTAGIFGYAA